MGWGEKTNPNSTWYKKRHPKLEIPIGVTPKGEVVEATVMRPKNRLTKFIKNIWTTKSTTGQLGPKEN